MPRTRPPYPPEFRAEAVKLARSSEKPVSELARDFGVSTETLRNWLRQQQIDTGKRKGVTTDEREELRRLRKENKVLRRLRRSWSAAWRSRPVRLRGRPSSSTWRHSTTPAAYTRLSATGAPPTSRKIEWKKPASRKVNVSVLAGNSTRT